MTQMKDVHEFLAQPRIAVVGASHDPAHFSRAVMKELIERGYEVIPVNPDTQAIDGRRCYARTSDITPPPEAALIMTPPGASKDVVEDAASAGVRRVWLHRGAGQGAVSEAAVERAQELGLSLVAGQCPLMFLPDSGFPHSVHRFFKRLAGTLPT